MLRTADDIVFTAVNIISPTADNIMLRKPVVIIYTVVYII